MGFSAKQVQALRRNLDPRYIRTREANGQELSYIEGWYAISEANRIFGFDGWNRETIESRCVLTRENRGTFLTVYIAKVRITVHTGGATIIREGHGIAERRDVSPHVRQIQQLVWISEPNHNRLDARGDQRFDHILRGLRGMPHRVAILMRQ